MKERVFEQFPFVDVAFGPGQVHKLAEFLTSDSLTAQGYFEFEGFTGHLPMKRERDFQGWVHLRRLHLKGDDNQTLQDPYHRIKQRRDVNAPEENHPNQVA